MFVKFTFWYFCIFTEFQNYLKRKDIAKQQDKSEQANVRDVSSQTEFMSRTTLADDFVAINVSGMKSMTVETLEEKKTVKKYFFETSI